MRVVPSQNFHSVFLQDPFLLIYYYNSNQWMHAVYSNHNDITTHQLLHVSDLLTHHQEAHDCTNHLLNVFCMYYDLIAWSAFVGSKCNNWIVIHGIENVKYFFIFPFHLGRDPQRGLISRSKVGIHFWIITSNITLFILRLLNDAISIAEAFCAKIDVESSEFRVIQKWCCLYWMPGCSHGCLRKIANRLHPEYKFYMLLR
jgi:hypothetical protein